MDIKAVIFDFDGVLLDTEATLLAAWQQEYRWHGLELETESFWPGHGGDVTEERYARLAAAVGPAFDRDASHARRIAYRDELNSRLELCPGIGGWLDTAVASGFRLAIASSSGRAWVLPLLATTGRSADFEVIACGDEVAAPKPAPDVYLLALTRLGISPGQAIAIEDSPHGVAAAKAAGLRCVAIPSREMDTGSFAGADLVLASATETSLDEAIAAATR
ncbi:MAG: HAD-IA family hydrolase [Streptosporangiaceae bacterium]